MSEALLKRIDSKLTHIISKPVKSPETWVKSTVIIKLTGWTYEEMRAARNHTYVSWKKDEKGFWYLLESLNPVFIKNK
jgi:hypothetical protein